MLVLIVQCENEPLLLHRVEFDLVEEDFPISLINLEIIGFLFRKRLEVAPALYVPVGELDLIWVILVFIGELVVKRWLLGKSIPKICRHLRSTGLCTRLFAFKLLAFSNN